MDGMDVKVEDEIKALERKLALLKMGDPEEVFSCPVCGGKFSKYANHDELKMCFRCFDRENFKEMQEHAKEILGGRIIGFKLERPYLVSLNPEAQFRSITIKTRQGKVVKLKKPEEVHYAL